MSERRQILIVDDDSETRESLQAILVTHGYDVIGAANGSEGLRKLREGLRPGLILLDLMMPERNGFQFRIEQVVDPTLADIPVVLYTGDPQAYEEGKVLGAVGCLVKPIVVADLLKLLDTYC